VTPASGTAEPRAYRSLVEALLEDPRISEGQMMGMPVVKLGGRILCGRAGAELVVKLGRERVSALVEAGRASPFDPTGRGAPMKDWALIGADDEDWLALALEAKWLLDS
jgi:hypothetical protein